MLRKYTLLSLFVSIAYLSFGQSGQDFPSFEDNTIIAINKISIYPNPSTEIVNIEIINSELFNTEFIVHNIIGNKMNVRVVKRENNLYSLHVKDLPPGYYLVSIKDRDVNFSKTYKFLKK